MESDRFSESHKILGLDDPDFTWVDRLPSYSLGNYTIKSIDWKKDTSPNTLIVARPDEFSGNKNPIKMINFPDGQPDIYIYAKTN